MKAFKLNFNFTKLRKTGIKEKAKRLKSRKRIPEVDRLDGQWAQWLIGSMVDRLDGQWSQ